MNEELPVFPKEESFEDGIRTRIKDLKAERRSNLISTLVFAGFSIGSDIVANAVIAGVTDHRWENILFFVGIQTLFIALAGHYVGKAGGNSSEIRECKDILKELPKKLKGERENLS